MIRTRTSRIVAAALGAAAVAVLSGCGPMKAGAAAVVDGQRIADGQIQTQVAQIVALEKTYGGSETAPTAALAQAQISQLVDVAVWQRVADSLGLDVTPQMDAKTRTSIVSEARQALAGSKFTGSDDEAVAVYELLGQQQGGTDVAPGGMATFVRWNSLIDAVVSAEEQKLNLTPSDQNVNTKLHAAIDPLLASAASQVKATVSPRYGSFDPHQLAVVATAPDWLRTVSSTAATVPVQQAPAPGQG